MYIYLIFKVRFSDYFFMRVPFRHPLNPPLPESHRGTLACLSKLNTVYTYGLGCYKNKNVKT